MTAYSFQCDVGHIVFFGSKITFKITPSTLAFELPQSTCQSRTLDISCTKLLLNILQLYLVKYNLPFLRFCALIFSELPFKKMYDYKKVLVVT